MSQWPIGTGDVNDFYKWIGSHLLTLAMSRINPLCGWLDGTEYRLTHKEWIGECLTA